LSLKTFGHAWRALRSGFRQTEVQGDPWQLGGAFVITPEGKTVYEHVSREAGDHPDNADLLRALDEYVSSRERT
jgi:hypothetical protein